MKNQSRIKLVENGRIKFKSKIKIKIEIKIKIKITSR